MANVQRSRLSLWWHGIPIRWQVLTAILATFIVTGFLAGFVSVIDARRRAEVETKFHLALWQHYIGSQYANLRSQSELQRAIKKMRAELARARHVTVAITEYANGQTMTLSENASAAETSDEDAAAPGWFVDLVQSKSDVRNVEVTINGDRVASILVTAKPDDEIAEAWVLLRKVALWWIAGLMLTMLGLYFILGYILAPLINFATGIRQLEGGHYGVRLPDPGIQELGPVATNFNLLAQALEKTKADNSQLYQQLIAVQEDERRQIAADLHDEVGPCLFGIMASTSSISRLTKEIPQAQAVAILDATHEINHISNKLRAMNRGLLARLRPIALGRVSLQELLSDLLTGFARANPDVRFDHFLDGLPRSFGEAIDLTIYRCVQEGLTNALRHGAASHVWIHMGMTDQQQDQRHASISLSITDNGVGIEPGAPFGFGISSMRERIRLLNGTLSIAAQEGGGTRLHIDIPRTATNKSAA